MMVLVLLPVLGIIDDQSVVAQASESSSLDEMRGGLAQVGGDHHLTEALNLLRLHQLPQRLRGKSRDI